LPEHWAEWAGLVPIAAPADVLAPDGDEA
jgi:hypothetical protein